MTKYKITTSINLSRNLAFLPKLVSVGKLIIHF